MSLLKRFKKWIGNMFSVIKVHQKNEAVDRDIELVDHVNRIRNIKDDVMDLIRVEEQMSTTKYNVVEYYNEIDELRLSALNSLALGMYSNRMQYKLINSILVESTEVVDLISKLVLMGSTDIDMKRKCLAHRESTF
jgi:hypothetical protein